LEARHRALGFSLAKASNAAIFCLPHHLPGEIEAQLARAGGHCDHRGDRLRFGFGICLSAADWRGAVGRLAHVRAVRIVIRGLAPRIHLAAALLELNKDGLPGLRPAMTEKYVN
jgi:hypothetical protein